jgi:hypothetical protein
MRRFDKKDNIRKANLLAEQRYLQSKGLISEDLTLQYADRPSANSPIIEIGYDDYGILYKFGFDIREDEEISLSELINGIQTAKIGLQDAIEGASDLTSFDYQREIELLKKLTTFAEQSKMDNNNVVMLKSNMNHPNQEWTDKEDKNMNDMWDSWNNQEDYDSYKHNYGLSEDNVESQFSKPSFADSIVKGAQSSLHEDGNDTYFETLSEVLDAVRQKAAQLGFEVDEQTIWTNFGTGGISYETEKSANIPLLQNGEPILDKRGNEANRYIRVSIYRMPSGRYELTMYKTW